MKVFFAMCNFSFKVSLRVWANYSATGLDNVPRAGPLIVVANHQSNMDPPVIARALRRRIFFPAKRELFKFPFFALLLHWWGSFPLNRGEPDLGAYRRIRRILSKPDGAVALFPEGTRSRGAMRKARSGPARIAMQTGATVLPVGVTGTYVLGGVLRALNPEATITVTVGRPFKVVNTGSEPEEALEGATEEVMARIAELLPESYRGAYSDAVGRERVFTRDLPSMAG